LSNSGLKGDGKFKSKGQMKFSIRNKDGRNKGEPDVVASR